MIFRFPSTVKVSRASARVHFELPPSRLLSVCEYYVHVECQDFAVADCKENATYLPGKNLSSVHHEHHWREGNLPSNSKCALCKKTCWASECLSGYRCEWCGMTVSPGSRPQARVSRLFASATPPATSTYRRSVRSASWSRSTFLRMPSAFQGRRCRWRPSLVCKCAERILCLVSTHTLHTLTHSTCLTLER